MESGFDNFRDCIHIVEYNDLCEHGPCVVDEIYDFLDLPRYKHDFENIINTSPEDDDDAYGLSGLHDIKPRLLRSNTNAKEILGDRLNRQYLNLEFWR